MKACRLLNLSHGDHSKLNELLKRVEDNKIASDDKEMVNGNKGSELGKNEKEVWVDPKTKKLFT